MSQSRFNALFVQQRLSLLRTLQRMVGNPSTAEDLLQETYLRVARALAERPVTHLEPFVFQTARNLALDHLRARRAQARTLVDDVPEQVLHNVAAPLGSSEDAAHAEQLLKHLSSHLGRLTERQQRIFVLSRVQGASYLEIAQQLKVSASTVQKELKLIMSLCMDIAQRLG
ncbi:RNA polymerase sigma factor [Pseudomonas phoenicis]|uniref:RNA polymerase sigma factor n=1 Tax=unclassified Pseudomonas TaxID=196821 RepID=UPI00399F5ED6